MAGAELTDFQKKRLENIKRNNDLLKKLQLQGAANNIKREAGVDTVNRHDERLKKKKKIAAVKKKNDDANKKVSMPTRRSRRLMGQKLEDEKGIPNVSDTQLMKMGKAQDLESLEEVKETPVIGDVKLSDLIKTEDGVDEEELLSKFKQFSNKNFSSGDFFDIIRKRQNENSDDTNLEKQQNAFDLELYDVFQPNEIKITYERISAMFFHPSTEKKLIVAGDTSGTIGLWNVRDDPLAENGEDDMVEPDITKVKFFTKNVGKIECFPTDTSTLLTTSYDGSIRTLNLNNLKSADITTLRNQYEDPMGVSDCQFSYENPNVLYITTLGGEFTQLDLRAKPSEMKYWRLSDKKIGSMAINPQRPYEIATGSLDRTLRIWDVRKTVVTPEWSQYEDYDSHDIVSTFDSRLSVSAVSYSPTDGTLVCNGYDDTIRLFDVNGTLPEDLDTNSKIVLKHNCQSGRWTSILKARFKPDQNVFAIANMSRAIDIYNSEGQQLAHLATATVPAVLGWHPLQNWIAGGNSSGKVFLFTDK
ncbi:hypothetical protein RNJ44_04798 [Nakaseomyces bracarensis]|uniref:DNA damage-binding protein CMR1 n=1 Tax=Nakaseomyces bracarensis TaxID=273131 RepID=A0ABR4NVY5_9SACH